MNAATELALGRFLREMGGYLESVQDSGRLLRHVLRETQQFLRADEACLAVAVPGSARPEIQFAFPTGAEWPLDLLGQFLAADERVISPKTYLLAPVRRRGRGWGVLALRRRESPFADGAGRALSRVAGLSSRFLGHLDLARVLDVRARIDRKIREQLRPRDLFYQLLDALRSLTGYDHSSALLVVSESGDALELVAEQVAWRKGRSRRIGRKLPLTAAACDLLRTEVTYGFRHGPQGWVGWPEPGAEPLALLLDMDRASEPGDGGEPHARPADLLLAPLSTREGPIGALLLTARCAGAFAEHERRVLEQFTMPASVAIQYMRRTESLQTRMLEAEKKHVVANLARGVSHDVNNALGAVLPLVQQLLVDLRSAPPGAAPDPVQLARDLDQIEQSVKVCRRIFGGMLSIARGEQRQIGHGNVRRALDSTLAVLRDGLERQRITMHVELADDLPLTRAGQGDLEQLFLNLITNARDAMAEGGRLDVSVHAHGAMIETRITDNGCGIAPEHLERVQEPFFTTKPNGSGLGLSICRALIWEVRGSLAIESAVGHGTTVRILLPALEPALAETPA